MLEEIFQTSEATDLCRKAKIESINSLQSYLLINNA